MRTQTYLITVLGAVLLHASCGDTSTKFCHTGIRCPVNMNCAAVEAACIFDLCGNGVEDPDEVCDDGGITSGDGCRADCLSTEECGNGLLDAAVGEECDDAGESGRCDVDCTFAVCGDGIRNVTAGEECDDFGNSPSCTALCTYSICGDNFHNPAAGEMCDSGGNDVAACDSDCTLPECGDGHTNGSTVPSEECDTAGVDTSFCDSGKCTEPECGDGYWNTAVEQCDLGGLNSDVGDCLLSCKNATCGDGFVHSDPAIEQCDDGDEIDRSNGCSGGCRFTTGFTCAQNDLDDLGEPGTETGLKIRSRPFTVLGNHSGPRAVRISVAGEPGMAQYYAFPLVTMNLPLDESDQLWRISVIPGSSSHEFDFMIETMAGRDFNLIGGALYVIGFDNLHSTFRCSPILHAGEVSGISVGTASQTEVKVLPFTPMYGYITGAGMDFDNNLGWHVKQVTPGCPPLYTTIKYEDSTPNTDILWQNCNLSLAETIRVTRREEVVYSGGEKEVYFQIHPSADVIWLPIINEYYASGEDGDGHSSDFGYLVWCAEGGSQLTCTINALDGDDGSYIRVQLLILEATNGF